MQFSPLLASELRWRRFECLHRARLKKKSPLRAQRRGACTARALRPAKTNVTETRNNGRTKRTGAHLRAMGPTTPSWDRQGARNFVLRLSCPPSSSDATVRRLSVSSWWPYRNTHHHRKSRETPRSSPDRHRLDGGGGEGRRGGGRRAREGGATAAARAERGDREHRVAELLALESVGGGTCRGYSSLLKRRDSCPLAIHGRRPASLPRHLRHMHRASLRQRWTQITGE